VSGRKDTGGIFAATVGRPVALGVLFVTLIVMGLLAYARIPLQLLPSGFAEPEVKIWVSNSGSSARENEEQIARVIEEQLRTLTGIEELESWSDSDSVFFDVDFDGNADMDLAKAEVRDRLERARPLLPASADEPATWTESANSLPITFFGVLLKGDEETRDHLMEKVVVPRLEAVQGIGSVTCWGILQDSVRILLDEDKVFAAKVDIGPIIQRLSGDNFALPMGDIDDGGREILLRSDMRFSSLEEIEEFPIGNGLKIGDIGRVARVKSVSDSLSYIDGAIAYYGMAAKDSQSNVVETSRNWIAALEELKQDPVLEGRMSYMVFFLQGDMIEGALGQLRETAMWGGLLAVVVLFVFLRRVRLTLCVALSIPVSALLAITWQFFSGGSFNILTMTGITLGIGMLVDNAVVVVENIARVRQGGHYDAHQSAVVGTRQISLAITLATLTTVVVFLPLVFMADNPLVRVMFGGIGIPLSVSLLASLLVALLFLPVITARLLGPPPRLLRSTPGALRALARAPVRVVALLVAGLRALSHLFVSSCFRASRRALALLSHPVPRWGLVGLILLAASGVLLSLLGGGGGFGESLGAFGQGFPSISGPASVVVGVVAALAVAIVAIGFPRWNARPRLGPQRPASFVPRSDSLVGMATDLNQLLVGWTLRHRLLGTLVAAFSFLTVLFPMKNMTVTPFGQDNNADSVDFEVAFNSDFSLSEAADEVQIYVDFLESKKEEYGFDHHSCRFDDVDASLAIYWDQPKPRAFFRDVERRLQEELPEVPGHTIVFYDQEQVSETSQTVARFTLRGPDSTELERLGKQAERLLAGVPGLSEVRRASETSPDQVNVEIDRDLAQQMGVTTDAIQQNIAWALRGFALPRFQENGRDVPFLIEFDEEEIAGLSTLRDLTVFTDTGAVSLASVADLGFGKGSQRIYRRDGQTSYTLTARVGDPLQVIPITEAGYAALEGLELPRGYSIDRQDSARVRQEEEMRDLQAALLLAVVLVFLLMGILFESVLLPFSVLFTIPFAIMGSMWTLFLVGTPMDSMGWIGMIILAGVVVNNGIVLIDRIHGLRSGRTRDEAVLLGCSQRVRPVLMTALTTVCGLFPMMVTEPPGNDSLDYRALATIVAGGLIASTFFTLWVVPLAYTVIDDLAAVFRGWLRWWMRAPGRRTEELGSLPPTPATAGGGGSSLPSRVEDRSE